MDATAVASVHEELSYVDPAFCLSYLAHTFLLVNNLAANANAEQCCLYLPRLCDGTQIGGMCMSEPSAGTNVLGMKTNAKKK
jgi:isovaleryl-CoA dehydrogenase